MRADNCLKQEVQCCILQCLSRIRKMPQPAFLSRRCAPITRGKPAISIFLIPCPFNFDL